MRRFVTFLFSFLTAASLVLAGASVAAAGSVDPSTLQPPPPPGSRCFEAGNQVICDTVLNFYPVNEPAIDAPCGTLYLTGTDLRNGFRYYTDGLITHRHVTGALNGTLTLSSTGEGPYLKISGHWNWWSVWAVPGGDDEDSVTTESGLELRVSGPGIGSGFQIAGHFLPEGTAHGLITAFSDESMALLCEALAT
jgi:hypothetical protein